MNNYKIMSESLIPPFKHKSNHIKGKNSVSKPHLISFNHENIFNSHNVTKQNRNNTPTKSDNEIKKSVKTINNKSFVLRPKYRKVNHSKIDKILSKKLIYNNGNSFTFNVKKILKNRDNKVNQDKNKNNPFHSRIKSFQLDFKDKYYLNNFNKTENNIYDDKTMIKLNGNKKNIINRKQDNLYKDYSMTNNIYLNKTNNIFEDIEENSTKNTKIIEQKILTLDNIDREEKIIIISDRNSKIDTEKEINKNANIQNYKKISNLTNKNKNIINNSFYKRNRAFSPCMRNKMNNIRKNILSNKEKAKKDISSIIDKKFKENNFSKTKINFRKDKNLNEYENKKNISILIQKIRDKRQSIQTNKKDNIIRNDYAKNISFVKERKTVSNGFNPFQLKKNDNKKNIKDNKINPMANKLKSPLTFRKTNNLNETKKDNNEKEISSIIQIKDNKINYKNNKKIYNNRIPKKIKIKKKDKTIKFNDNEKKCITSKSQNDVLSDFVVKTLNKEEQIKDKNNNLHKEKSPKDFDDKKIEKMENLCQKGFSGPGIKKINQDNFFIYNNFMNNPDYIYAGVCDGHGTYGHNVSGYLVYNLPLTINDILIKEKMETITEKNTPKIISIIKNIFLEIDKNISLDSRIDSLFSGSTCVSIIFTPSKLICANLGDSRCVIGKYDGKNWYAKNISNDHKPSDIFEKERIIQNGGRIESYKDEEGNYVGPKRVWLKNEDVPGLAMSRSFGDGIAHSVGVISDPEITEYSFLYEDKFIILASDGIWEFISSDECINLVKDFYVKKDINGALNFLYKEASKRWIIEEEVIDDITLIIIFFE